MKKFEELTMDELKALYDEKVKQEVEEVEEKPKRWRAERGEMYWYVNEIGMIFRVTECSTRSDDYFYNSGNYFQTKEQAEEYEKKLILQQEYKDWCRFDCDWNDDYQPKVFVYYDFISKDIYCENNYRDKRQGVTYAESEERIKKFIDKVGEEDFKKYILEV